MYAKYIRYGAIAAMLAVVTGAFGAHTLKKIITAEYLDVWNKAVLYQFIHAFALIVTGLIPKENASVKIDHAAKAFMTGIICFSGSLYILSLKEVLNINFNFIGPVTPLGGLLFITGWIFLLLSLRSKQSVK